MKPTRCYICGNEFNSNYTRRCSNSNNTCCKPARGANPEIASCVRCCKKLYPNRTLGTSPKDKEQEHKYCSSCGNTFPIKDYICGCCPQGGSNSTRCKNCCKTYFHSCCWKPIQWREADRIGEVNFAYPEVKTFPDPSFTDATSSLLISNGMQRTCLSPKGFIHNSSKRFAAVEIEVSEYGNAKELNAALSKWGCSVVHDGSIVSNTNRSFEINTTPACGDALYNELKDICDGLIAADAKVNTSCGLHVHIDCRDLGYQEIQRFVAVYSRLEPVLFGSVHSSRINSAFCRPCGEYLSEGILKGIKPDTKSLKPAIIKKVYGDAALGNPNEYLRSKRDHYGRIRGNRNEVRYSAVNLHTYFLRGTVEFRLHHGAVDFNEIYGWVKLLLELFDSIKSISYSKLQDLLNKSEAKETQGKENITSGLFLMGQLVSKQSIDYFRNKLELSDYIRSNASFGDKILPATLMSNYRNKIQPQALITENLYLETI